MLSYTDAPPSYSVVTGSNVPPGGHADPFTPKRRSLSIQYVDEPWTSSSPRQRRPSWRAGNDYRRASADDMDSNPRGGERTGRRYSDCVGRGGVPSGLGEAEDGTKVRRRSGCWVQFARRTTLHGLKVYCFKDADSTFFKLRRSVCLLDGLFLF